MTIPITAVALDGKCTKKAQCAYMFKQVRFLLSNCRSHEFSSQIYSAKMDAAEISAIFFFITVICVEPGCARG
jgi:hypothetical protein